MTTEGLGHSLCREKRKHSVLYVFTFLTIPSTASEVWWSEFLGTDPGSVPGATRFSEKQWVWNGVHSASFFLFTI
jgi:hypothetical protein